MIVGTAGHIDHGKTALVRALTGVDTDRLPEEKRRGITLDLGYAYIDGTRPGQRLGFIDVPGHERLVHTMLAGATGIDHALLLVACDDGVMPQTREHLAVLALLGVPAATLVLTKRDRVPPARVDEVRREARALLAATSFRDAPVHVVSAVTGEGVAALKDHLLALAATAADAADAGADAHDAPDAGPPGGPAAARAATEGFRLAVDRAFTLEGLGAVATGTIVAGRVRVGDTLALLPASGGAAPRLVRVRSLHAQNAPADAAARGQRAALALAGVAREDLRRGQWLCDPAVVPPLPPGAAFSPTRRLDVRLRLAPAADAALRDGTTVHLHVGAEDLMARVDLLDRAVLAPGDEALAQLVTRGPVAAWRGDRFVLRDASASRTLAGGRVLDPAAPTRHRRAPERLALLAAWSSEDAAARWSAALDASPRGLDVDARRRAEGLAATPPWPEGTVRHGALAFSPAAWAALRGQAGAALDRFHAQCPDELGPTAERLRRLAGLALDEEAWRGLLDELVREGALARQGPWFHRPSHARALSEGEHRVARQVLPRLEAAGSDPPWVRDLAREAGMPEDAMRAAMRRLARHGRVFPVVKDLYYHARPLDALARLAGDLARRDGEVRAAAFRDACGLGRKRAIQVLEFFDRAGLLRRVGEAHRLRGDPAMFADAASMGEDDPGGPPPAPRPG